MTRRVGLRLLIAVLAASAVALGWWLAQSLQPERRPDFSLPDLDGGIRHIGEWDGHVVVLNFWGSWCPPCLKEIPVFNALQADYGGSGLRFVGVAVDRLGAARAFTETTPLAYPSLIGVADAMAVGRAYGNEDGAVPYTVIIDRDGIIRHRLRGEVDRDGLEPLLLALLDDR